MFVVLSTNIAEHFSEVHETLQRISNSVEIYRNSLNLADTLLNLTIIRFGERCLLFSRLRTLAAELVV
jgi:hypothetical protein